MIIKGMLLLLDKSNYIVFVLVCFLFAMFTIIMLATSKPTKEHHFDVVCLKGTEYWFKQFGYKAVLAVKYNSDSGEIETCEE